MLGYINKHFEPTSCIPFVGIRKTTRSGVRRLRAIMYTSKSYFYGDVGGGISLVSDKTYVHRSGVPTRYRPLVEPCVRLPMRSTVL